LLHPFRERADLVPGACREPDEVEDLARERDVAGAGWPEEAAVEREHLERAEPLGEAEELGQVADPASRLPIARGAPTASASPALGRARPRSSFTVVVVPAPFGPRNPKTSPRSTVIDSPVRAALFR